MKTVFQAATAVEAHMVSELLHQRGIESARVEGEYLQGGVGLLQAINLVRVVVADQDLVMARQIIADWESDQRDVSSDVDAAVGNKMTAPAKAHQSGVVMLLLGVLLGAGVMFLWHKTPITRDGVDYDGDGEMDVRLLYLGGFLSRAEYDRNLDGSIDMIDNFRANGMVKSSRVDTDFDGSFETIYRYRYDQIRQIDSDTDNNGSVDLLMQYQHGELSRVTIQNMPGSATIKHMYYRLNKLICAELDEDGDGMIETRIDYDFLERPIQRSRAGDGCTSIALN